jgi:hypothetical protein
MFRVGLSICLMLSVAQGPWLCCCTVARLFLAAGLGRAAGPPREASPSRHDCCCCCHDGQSSGHGNTAGPQRPGPAPARHPCPCRQHRPDLTSLVPPQGPATSPSLVTYNIPAPAAVVLPASLPAPDSCLHGGGTERDLPFLTARDILRALHILRC